MTQSTQVVKEQLEQTASDPANRLFQIEDATT